MKYRYRLLICITFYFIISYAYCQKTIITGRVVDRNTRSPLPFATIELYNQKTGTIADTNGNFKMPVNGTICLNDTIEFSYLGYEKYKLSVEDFVKLDAQLFELIAKPIVLDEFKILPKKFKIQTIGIKVKKPDQLQQASIFSGNLGNFIENNNHKKGWVKSVNFYIGEKGHFDAPFRIRFYDVNTYDTSPGNDLLNQNIIVNATKPGWFKVDLTDYFISFPEDGVFVMMEWINSGGQYFYFSEILKTDKNTGKKIPTETKFYGQTLGAVRGNPKMLTWGRGLGQSWIPYRFYYKGYLNMMINIDVAFPLEK